MLEILTCQSSALSAQNGELRSAAGLSLVGRARVASLDLGGAGNNDHGHSGSADDGGELHIDGWSFE